MDALFFVLMKIADDALRTAEATLLGHYFQKTQFKSVKKITHL